MIIGDRLRALREEKKLSQGDIERKTGLLRCYISRVENGHTVPAIETLEKIVHAMEIPLYQIFYENPNGKEPEMLKVPSRSDLNLSRKDAGIVTRLSGLVSRMNDKDKAILVSMATKLAAR